MALGLTSLKHAIAGNMRLATGVIAFDSSYPTGGEPFAPANIGLRTIEFIEIHQTKGLVFEYDYTNQKVLAYAQGWTVGATAAVVIDDFPVSAGPGVSAGKSVGLETGAGAGTHGLGALKEVPSTNDLSTITGVRFFAVGF